MLTNILDYLKHSTEKYGDKTAFSDSADSVTYRGLDVLSDSIASFLMTEIPGKNEPAAVLIDRRKLLCSCGQPASAKKNLPHIRDFEAKSSDFF